MMKTKPKVLSEATNENPLVNKEAMDKFINGATADIKEYSEPEVKNKPVEKPVKASKFVQLPIEILQRLKEESLARSTIGNRVTESQLIEEALRAYLDI